VPGKATFELAFETTDIDDLFRRACDAGAKPMQEPRRESWGQTMAYVSDLDGFLVEICSPVAATAQ
jgi:lactoylglutathione lyase